MSENLGPAQPGTPARRGPAGPPPGARAGGLPPSGSAPESGPRAAPPAFSVQLPAIDILALARTPWVVGAAAILIGLVLYRAGSVVSAFQRNAGYHTRQKLRRSGSSCSHPEASAPNWG